MSGETPNKNNQNLEQPTGWEELENRSFYDVNAQNDGFAGETNINSATGNARTFTQFDNYPRQEGETPTEYGARIKHMNQLTSEAQDELYRRSGRYQEELAAQAEYDRLTAKLDKAVQEGRMSKEHAQKLAEKQLEIFDQKADESHQKFQEDQALQDWVDSSDIYSREEVLKQHEAETANLQEKEATLTSEKEKISALENEKEAVLAGEAEGANAQETEQLSVAEAERRKAECEELLNGVVAEAERRKAEYQEMLERIEALQGENKGESKVDRKESLEEKKAELEKKRSELAELYAKNRRLFVGKANKEKFKEAKAEYNEMLDEYLKLQAEDSYESGKNELSNQLKNRFDALKESIESQLAEFAGGDLENTDKTPEEIEAERARLLKTAAEALKQEWKERTGQLETDINAEFVENFLKEENALEDATIDRLDNGTIFRKAISKVLANKYLKGALVGAAIAGLAVTGIGLGMGLAAGTASIGYGLTLGGAAAGAGRGAFMGALMSRQDSKNSAVREFASEEDIKNQLKDINVLDENSGTANVTNWLLDQYETAKDTDLSSNRKRTAISAGLGAAFGALLSGVQINQVPPQPNVEPEQIGTTPIEYQYQAANLDNVNIPEGHGISTTFQQLGGDLNDPAAFDQFTNIVHDIGNNYGLVPGDNGMVGAFAHTYPGTIDTWPADAQAYITDVANEAARQGLIPANTTVIGGGEPIYDTIERAAADIVPDAFMNFLAQATATAGIGAGAGLFAGRENRMPESSTPATPNSEPRTPEPTLEPTETETTPAEEETPPQEPEVSPQETETPLETPPETPAETPEGNSEAQAAEQPSQPESAPSPQEQALDENTRMLTKNELRNLTIQAGINDFDDESIDIITLPATANEQSANQQRIETWWEGLDDAHKEIVREYVSRQNSSNIYGSALRLFLAQEDRLRAENTPNNAV